MVGVVVRSRTRLLAAMAGLIVASVMFAAPSAVAAHPHRATASAVATLNDYWNGSAEWEFQHFYPKSPFSHSSDDDWGGGTMIKVGPDGNWYWFVRTSHPGNYPDGTAPAATDCPEASPQLDSTEVRKSTDKGATWSAPVTAVAATPNTAWACSATDGDVFWDGTRWQMLFQCKSHTASLTYGGGFWNICHLMNDSTDPTASTSKWYPSPSTATGVNPLNGLNPVMGDYSMAQYSSNPSADWSTGNDPWYQVCDTTPDPGGTTPRNPDCVSLEGQTHAVNGIGTPSIWTDPSQPGWYMVDVHGIDNRATNQKGFLYQGIVKTQDWLHFTALATGMPDDAIFDPTDASPWNIASDWSPASSIWNQPNIGNVGGGGGSVLHDPHDGRFYDVVEASTGGYPAISTQATAAGIGIFRTSSISSTTWDQPNLPGRQNPIWYSQQETLNDEYSPARFLPAYVSLFEDPGTGETYLTGLRSGSEDQTHQGVFLYKLVFNLLKNGDAQRCIDTAPWTLADATAPSNSFTAWRDGNWSSTGGCYFASIAPIRQDVVLPPTRSYTSVTWGGSVAARESAIRGGVAVPGLGSIPPGPSAFGSLHTVATVRITLTQLDSGGAVLATSSIDVPTGANVNEYEAYGPNTAYHVVGPQTVVLASGVATLRYTISLPVTASVSGLPVELLADHTYITPV